MKSSESVTDAQLKMAENAAKVNGRLEQVIAHNLIHGLCNPDDWSRTIGHAYYMDVDLGLPHTVLAVQIPTSRLGSLKKHLTQFDGGNTLWATEGNVGAMIVRCDNPSDLEEKAKDIFRGFIYAKPPEISVGIGKVPKDFSDFPDSWYQAVAALKLGQMLNQDHQADINYQDHICGNVTHINSLGSYSLLFNQRNHEELKIYRDRILKPLLDYHFQERGPLLITTLRNWLRWGYSLEKTSQEMFLHINTLKYRLKRIGELIGIPIPEFREGDTFTALYNALLIDQALPVMDILDQLCWRADDKH